MMGNCRICKHCGGSNPANRRFCELCGNLVSKSCPACGFDTIAGARFCGGCGLHLGMTEAERPDEIDSGESRGRAAETDSLGMRVQGEHKRVTVLFADIRGSLGLIEQIDAESACVVLDGAIEVMIEAVRGHSGTVNRVMGDGVMAVFGAPLAQEDHGVRACHAALSILAGLKGDAKAIWARFGLELEVRIGISSGAVMVRTIRGEVPIPYDVIGTTAHLASRMEQLAPQGTVWLTEATARLVKGFFDLCPIGPVPIRGLSKPIEVFELRRGLPRTAFDLALAQGLSPFVGRRNEMQELELALQQAATGYGRLVALVGEPGIGKSRLAYEFVQSAKLVQSLLLTTVPSGYGTAAPWQKLAGLLRSLFRIDTQDEAGPTRIQVHHHLAAMGSNLLEHETPLLASLDVPADDDQGWRELEPKLRRDRIQKAFLALFDHLSRDRLVVIVLEDLHDSDAQTIETLQMLCSELVHKRIMLLITHRPHFEHGWPSDIPYHQMKLGPLPQEHVQELLDDLLGAAPDLGPIKGHLATRAEGNPFFLEETVRELVDSGVLAGEPRAYRLTTRAIPDHLLPPTVQAVIEARIDRLAFEDKRLLRAAAVIGETVDPVLLRAVIGHPEKTLEQGISRLCSLDFLQMAGPGQKPLLRFRHALLREVAYRTLPGWQRRAAHQRIVETLNSGQSEPSNERLGALVDHALNAELWEPAYGFAMELARRAMMQSASLDAIAACEKAERALARLDDLADPLTKTLELRFAQIDAYFAAGNHVRVAAEIDEACMLASKLGNQRQMVRALSLKAFRSWLQGEMDEAVFAGKHARMIGAAADHLDARINTAYRHGVYLLARGDYLASVAAFEDALQLIPEDRIGERFGVLTIVSAAARSVCARALAELLDFERARCLAREAMSIARAFHHPFTILYVAQEVGILYLRTREHAEAIAVLSEGYDFAREMPLNLLRPAVASELGMALVESGRGVEGLELLEEALACASSLKLIPQFGQQLGYLARGRLAAGDVNEAAMLAGEALSHTQRYHERGDEGWIRYLLAEITESRQPRQAPKEFIAVRDLARARGLLTLEDRCRNRLRDFNSPAALATPVEHQAPSRRLGHAGGMHRGRVP
jgi:class 3 adenylate cyclase/tetratricopeptide (TPR) repeat protein